MREALVFADLEVFGRTSFVFPTLIVSRRLDQTKAHIP